MVIGKGEHSFPTFLHGEHATIPFPRSQSSLGAGIYSMGTRLREILTSPFSFVSRLIRISPAGEFYRVAGLATPALMTTRRKSASSPPNVAGCSSQAQMQPNGAVIAAKYM